MFVLVIILALIGDARGRVVRSDIPFVVLPGRARLTPSAVRLPDGTEYPLVFGEYAGPGINVQVHPVGQQVTVVRPGELLEIANNGETRRIQLAGGLVPEPTIVGWECAVEYYVGAEVTAQVGLTLAQTQVESVATQVAAIYANYPAIAQPAIYGTVQTTDVGVYTDHDQVLFAFQASVAPLDSGICARYFMGERSFDDNTIGIAYRDGGCDLYYGVGAVFDVTSSALAILTLAHELGHTMDAGHDTTGNYIMYPQLGGGTLPIFSNESQSSMAAWTATADCLTAINISLTPPVSTPAPSTPGVSNIGAIIGGVLGGAVLLGLGVLLIIRAIRPPDSVKTKTGYVKL